MTWAARHPSRGGTTHGSRSTSARTTSSGPTASLMNSTPSGRRFEAEFAALAGIREPDDASMRRLDWRRHDRHAFSSISVRRDGAIATRMRNWSRQGLDGRPPPQVQSSLRTPRGGDPRTGCPRRHCGESPVTIASHGMEPRYAHTHRVDGQLQRAREPRGRRATHTIYRLDRAADALGCDLSRLPFTLRVLLENLLRGEDGTAVTREQIEAIGAWEAQAAPSQEIAFRPARVLLQDFTGVPAIVDLAAMRDAMAALGGDPARINPQQPLTSSSTTPYRSTSSAPTPPSCSTSPASSNATASATSSCAGASRRSTASASSRLGPASSTRSTSSTSRPSCSPPTARRTPTRWSGPTRTPR